jgi:hypothetical protein
MPYLGGWVGRRSPTTTVDDFEAGTSEDLSSQWRERRALCDSGPPRMAAEPIFAAGGRPPFAS